MRWRGSSQHEWAAEQAGVPPAIHCASHSRSFDQRFRPEVFFTARAMAFSCPNRMTRAAKAGSWNKSYEVRSTRDADGVREAGNNSDDISPEPHFAQGIVDWTSKRASSGSNQMFTGRVAFRRHGARQQWMTDPIAPRRKTRGGLPLYSVLAIEAALIPGLVFGMSLPQVEGFPTSLLHRLMDFGGSARMALRLISFLINDKLGPSCKFSISLLLASTGSWSRIETSSE